MVYICSRSDTAAKAQQQQQHKHGSVVLRQAHPVCVSFQQQAAARRGVWRMLCMHAACSGSNSSRVPVPSCAAAPPFKAYTHHQADCCVLYTAFSALAVTGLLLPYAETDHCPGHWAHGWIPPCAAVRPPLHHTGRVWNLRAPALPRHWLQADSNAGPVVCI
jgi:hypothetical protein